MEGTGIFQFRRRPFTPLLFAAHRTRRRSSAGSCRTRLPSVPGLRTILGAGKLTGRLASGTSIGALAAITASERAGAMTVEPRTAYSVLRASQDFRGGEGGVGADGHRRATATSTR